MLTQEKLNKHCVELASKPFADASHGNLKINYTKCIGNFYSGSLDFLMSMYEQFVNGVMPDGDSLFETPAKTIDLMNLIGSIKGRLEIDMQRAAYGKK